MLIGELSKRSGLSRDTIRYYERLLLIVVKDRPPGSHYKNYGQEVFERLQQIQQLKGLGFTLNEVRRLLLTNGAAHPCKELPGQLSEQIARIDKQLASLLKFKSSLMAMRSACFGECDISTGLPNCVPIPGASQETSK